MEDLEKAYVKEEVLVLFFFFFRHSVDKILNPEFCLKKKEKENKGGKKVSAMAWMLPWMDQSRLRV